jgi:hypothetical protein
MTPSPDCSRNFLWQKAIFSYYKKATNGSFLKLRKKAGCGKKLQRKAGLASN